MQRLGGCDWGRRMVIEPCSEGCNGFQEGVGVCMDCGGEGVRRYEIPCAVTDCASAYCQQEEVGSAEEDIVAFVFVTVERGGETKLFK